MIVYNVEQAELFLLLISTTCLITTTCLLASCLLSISTATIIAKTMFVSFKFVHCSSFLVLRTVDDNVDDGAN